MSITSGHLKNRHEPAVSLDLLFGLYIIVLLRTNIINKVLYQYTEFGARNFSNI